jgi:hypothetical protein
VTYYKTIELSDYGYRIVIFFLLSDYRNIEYQIGEFKKLSDNGIFDLGLNLLDYQILDSEKTISCPPLVSVQLFSHIEGPLCVRTLSMRAGI